MSDLRHLHTAPDSSRQHWVMTLRGDYEKIRRAVELIPGFRADVKTVPEGVKVTFHNLGDMRDINDIRNFKIALYRRIREQYERL